MYKKLEIENGVLREKTGFDNSSFKENRSFSNELWYGKVNKNKIWSKPAENCQTYFQVFIKKNWNMYNFANRIKIHYFCWGATIMKVCTRPTKELNFKVLGRSKPLWKMIRNVPKINSNLSTRTFAMSMLSGKNGTFGNFRAHIRRVPRHS